MPKNRTVEDIGSDREDLAKSLTGAEADAKKAKTAIGKTFNEHDTIRTALLEGLDEIEETKARARAEVKEMVDAWTKMAAKLDSIADRVKTAGKDVGKVLKDIESVDSGIAALTKELTKVGGDIKEMRAENESLKKVASNAERMRFEMADLETQLGELRPAPPRPAAAF